jgi:hypothetical protein
MKIKVFLIIGVFVLIFGLQIQTVYAGGQQESSTSRERTTVNTDVYFTEVEKNPFGSTSISSMAYGGGKFVAGGANGKMAYSTDGITWTAVRDSTFGSTSISTIAYGGGKFVAGGIGKIAYSTDGVTWAAVVDRMFSNRWIFVAYSGGKWFASYSLDGGRDAKVANSDDGITWTEAVNGRFGNAYGGGKWVAGTIGFDGRKINMAYSSDGVTWTESSTGLPVVGSGITGAHINNITYGGGKFVVVGGAWNGRGLPILAYSINGETWTPILNSLLSDQIVSVAYGGGKFVANDWSKNVAYSADGINWTQSNMLLEGGPISYGNGRFVIGGYNGKLVYSNKLE